MGNYFLDIFPITYSNVTSTTVCPGSNDPLYIASLLLYVQEVVTHLKNIGSNYSCNLIHVT